MNRWVVLCVFVLAGLSVRRATVSAQQLDPKALIGTWQVRDPNIKEPLTTIELSKDGDYQGGDWGRNWGGPNGLGARSWRIQGQELQFVCFKAGRKDPDVMLKGTIDPNTASDFKFKVTGGYYGAGNNLGCVFLLKRP